MKLGLAIRELHRSETALAKDLVEIADRHSVEPEVHHVAHDLARWSHAHLRELAEAARAYDVHLSDGPELPAPLSAIRTEPAELSLLADLRYLHQAAAGVSLDWELLAQGAQAVKDTGLVALAGRCHPQTLRQLKWTNAMLKILSPQTMAS